MSDPVQSETVRAQTLLGRRVRDHQARHLGRVYELEVGRVGNELCVTALLVGPRTWLTRFGWTWREHGKRVPWNQIETLDSIIRLRAEDGYAAR